MISNSVRKPRVFTVGHSDRTIEQFLRIIEKSSIRLVVDVRANPASARFPHFERAALALELDRRRISYRWFRGLGGKQKETPLAAQHTALREQSDRNYAAAMNTPEFETRLEELYGLLASTVAVILCAERDFERCHRRFLSDKIVLMGAEVVHIIDETEAVIHVVHPDLDVSEGKILYRKKQLDLIE